MIDIQLSGRHTLSTCTPSMHGPRAARRARDRHPHARAYVEPYHSRMSLTMRVLSLLSLVPVVFAKPGHYYSCTFNFTGGARLPYPYCNASLSVEERVADLLSRMTYEEKSAALDTGNPAVFRLGVPSMQVPAKSA